MATYKPCPFCGGKIVRMRAIDLIGGNPETRYLGCKTCDVTLSFGRCKSEQELVARWNKRKPE